MGLKFNPITGNLDLVGSGAKGDQGDPGQGVPIGGTTGQVLTKSSDTDYDTEWANAGSGDMSDLVDDTSPQLGGDLDTNGSNIVVATGDQLHIHNQSDQSTNYERGVFGFDSNVLKFMVDAGGTGTVRNFRVGTTQAGTDDTYIEFSAGGSPKFNFRRISSTGLNLVGASYTMSSSSAVQETLSLAPTANQSGTAGYRILRVNVTETATGSGVKNLLDLGTGGNTHMFVSNTGAAVFNEQGNDADFRVEGDTDTNLLFLDASTNMIGIGTNTPSSKLTVIGETATTGLYVDTDGVYVEDGGVEVNAGGATITGDVAISGGIITTQNIEVDATGSAFAILDRGATNNFSGFQFQTADSTKATVGLRNDSTDNFYFFLDGADAGKRSALSFILNTEAVFNDDGGDVNFRVEGDTDANLLFIDAGTDRIGVGTNSPQALLDVDGTARVTTLNIGGTDVTATATELNYTDGVTSAIQTQIDTKLTKDGTAKITVGTTEPTSPTTGDLWIDTN